MNTAKSICKKIQHGCSVLLGKIPSNFTFICFLNTTSEKAYNSPIKCFPKRHLRVSSKSSDVLAVLPILSHLKVLKGYVRNQVTSCIVLSCWCAGSWIAHFSCLGFFLLSVEKDKGVYTVTQLSLSVTAASCLWQLFSFIIQQFTQIPSLPNTALLI